MMVNPLSVYGALTLGAPAFGSRNHLSSVPMRLLTAVPMRLLNAVRCACKQRMRLYQGEKRSEAMRVRSAARGKP